MFGFRLITLFRLVRRLSKHIMIILSKNLAGTTAPLPPSGYAYARAKCQHNYCFRVFGMFVSMRTPSVFLGKLCLFSK